MPRVSARRERRTVVESGPVCANHLRPRSGNERLGRRNDPQQGSTNGSGYLAFAYAGQVWLYRVDDNGQLNWNGLASASVDVSVAPRQLRLESQGNTHRVIFNGVLLITYTDSNNLYTAGQPGFAADTSSLTVLTSPEAR